MAFEPGPNEGVPTRRSMLFKRAEANNIPLKTILTTIGIIVIVVGALLALLGMAGHAVGGRRHYF